MNIEPAQVNYVTCLGGGPIGTGWTAHFLARGFDVTIYLHDPAEEKSVRQLLNTAWNSLSEIGLAEGASLDRLTITSDLTTAVANAQFVQESVPEILTLKQTVYEQLGNLVPDGVVIASSTSGLSMSDIQARCATPERTVVAHPFNPPHLLPLVEMVGGEKTDPSALMWAENFYRLTGKEPLILKKEVPGFIATRLQEAIWREALHMVNEGEATVEQIDAAIVNGPGPRWALTGPCMTYHIGGGEGGMDYCLEQFGPALKFPWTRLVAPELTPELHREMVDGCDRMANGRNYAALAREQNTGLVEVLKAVNKWKVDCRTALEKSR